jgi:hypothetical protein
MNLHAINRILAMLAVAAASAAWYHKTYNQIDYAVQVWEHNKADDEEYRRYAYIKEFEFGTCYANEDGALLHGRILGFADMQRLDLCMKDFRENGRAELSIALDADPP